MGKLGEKFVITKFFALAHFRIFKEQQIVILKKKITVALLIFSLVKQDTFVCTHKDL